MIPGMDGFVCQRCGNCCRIEGQVRLTAEDITRLAEFLKITEAAFIQDYTRLDNLRKGLALKDGADGACLFLNAHGCQVNPAKPQQCRDFPVKWTNPGWEQTCAGLQALSQKSSATDSQS